MRLCISGASGFLGSALVDQLHASGHEVTRLVRRAPRTPDESAWDPGTGHVDQDVVDAADVVVNLSGAAIARWPWTAAYKRELMASRVGPTTVLARAIAASSGPKAALVSASGMAAYGQDRGDEVLTEDSGPDSPEAGGHLQQVVQAWEAATARAEDAGARVCHVRTSVVLDSDGGALPMLALPFRLGLGGRLGSGRQHFSSISRTDWVRGVERLATDEELSGPFNFAAPQVCTNAELTEIVARTLHRPAVVPVPAPAIRLALGELAPQLLGSMRVEPRRLSDAGFTWNHPDTEAIVAAALG